MIPLKLFHFILSGFVICALCFAGCTSGNGFGTPALKGDGFQDRTTGAVSDRFILQIALNAFYESFTVTKPGTQVEMYTIQGENLTMDGSASRWIIGYKEGTTPAFYAYDSMGPSYIQWKAWLPDSSIPLDRIIMPEDIFSRHSTEIATLQNPVTGRIETLELYGTTYTLSTQTGGRIKNVRIDALSGEIVP